MVSRQVHSSERPVGLSPSDLRTHVRTSGLRCRLQAVSLNLKLNRPPTFAIMGALVS